MEKSKCLSFLSAAVLCVVWNIPHPKCQNPQFLLNEYQPNLCMYWCSLKSTCQNSHGHMCMYRKNARGSWSTPTHFYCLSLLVNNIHCNEFIISYWCCLAAGILFFLKFLFILPPARPKLDCDTQKVYACGCWM